MIFILVSLKQQKEKLVDLGYNPAMGARPLRRTIQENIEDSIADFYIEHPEYKELVADLIDDKLLSLIKLKKQQKRLMKKFLLNKNVCQ